MSSREVSGNATPTTTRVRPRRWSFRTRLTITIASVFVAGGIALLTVQFLLVQGFFQSASATSVCTSVQTTDADGGAIGAEGNCIRVQSADGPFAGTQEVAVEGSGGISPEKLEATLDEYSVALSQEVLGSLLIGSVAVLAVFAVLATVLAGWLARRSLSRISEVTALTRRITTDDLDRRLELTGPDDEIKELGDTIDGMLDRLHTAFEAQDRFVQNASHELRTPLTVTRAALEIPLEQGRVPAELQPAVRRALSANAHSERLIAALLVLARGQLSVAEHEQVDLAAALTSEAAAVEPEAAARGVRLELDIPPAWQVAGAPELVRLALRNLLDNAVRYNDERGLVRVSAGAGASGGAGGVGVVVESTGRELTDAEVAGLAEPFFRGEDSRRADREGFGLGLSIVRAVAAAHGGSLELRPRPGGGLVATLNLAARG